MTYRDILHQNISITKLSDEVFNNDHPNGINPGYVNSGYVHELPIVGAPFIIETGINRILKTSPVVSYDPKTGILKTENSTYQIKIIKDDSE